MSTESEDPTTLLSYSCLCGQVAGDFPVPNRLIPLRFYACSCLICRHVSGQLMSLSVKIPMQCKPINTRGECKNYHAWNTNRQFCGNCGSAIRDGREESSEEINVYAGVFTSSLDDLQIIKPLGPIIYVLDTKDGGLREFLLGTRAWLEHPANSLEIPFGKGMSIPAEQRLAQKAHRCTKLYCQCHCGGVKFWITQPNEQSSEAWSPWPDLLRPYHHQSSDNSKDVKWWLRDNGTKYLAGLCACNSCRLGSGYGIQSWAFVPKINVRMMDGSPLEFECLESLQRYEISKGNYREFCKTCAATCFWHCEERPKLIDVSVGLMHAASGSRAEEWLEWETERVSFKELALNKTLVSALEDGLKSWDLARSMGDCSIRDDGVK